MQWQKQTTAKPSELPNVMPILWALPSFFRLVTFLLSHHHKLSTVLSPTRSLTETISPAESLQDKQERSTSKTCRKQNTTKNSKPLLLEKKNTETAWIPTSRGRAGIRIQYAHHTGLPGRLGFGWESFSTTIMAATHT